MFKAPKLDGEPCTNQADTGGTKLHAAAIDRPNVGHSIAIINYRFVLLL